MDPAPRCRHCGDAIGLYEPTILLIDGQARATSRAAVGNDAAQGDWYHAACFRLLRALEHGPGG